MRVLGVVVASLVMLGCIPFPHRVRLTPTTQGVVRTEQSPLASTLIRASASEDSECGEPFVETVTAPDGRFSLPPATKRQWLVIVMAHRYFEYHICVEREGEWLVAHRSREYTLADSGPWWKSHLDCKAYDSPDGFRVECDERLEPSRLPPN